MIRRFVLGLTMLALFVLAAGVGVPELEAKPAPGPSGEAPLTRITPQRTVAGFISSGLSTAALAEIRTAGAPANGDDTWDPSAIFNDGVDSTTLEVFVSSVGSRRVFVTTGGVLNEDPNAPPEFDLIDFDPVIELFDDGTSGDRSAGDGVYTRSGITASGPL